MNNYNNINNTEEEKNIESKNNKQDSFNALIEETKNTKKFPWVIIGIIVLTIATFGILGTHIQNVNKLHKYENNELIFEYNNNWYLANSKNNIILYYLNKNNKIIVNKLEKFTNLKFALNNENDNKKLYDIFLEAYKKNIEQTIVDGTKTFKLLDENILYARYDYKVNNSKGKGSYYILIDKNYNKIVTFASIIGDKREEFDEEFMKILKTFKYKNKTDENYLEFNSTVKKTYEIPNIMSYTIPNCWFMLENKNPYESIFKFNDNESMLNIRVFQNSSGELPNQILQDKFIKLYGGIKDEYSVNVNNRKWYVVKTDDYVNNRGNTYHNIIFYSLSKDNRIIYYVEEYVSNDMTPIKYKYLDKSINYIIQSINIYEKK